MESFKNFYMQTKNSLPHDNVKELIEFDIKSGKAIDLGCGAGRDTIFLIKNNWNVTSIDNKNTKSFITENLSKNELKNFKFIKNDFENIDLEKNNLVVANYSLPFCKKDFFPIFWNRITSSIQKNGYFVGNFFGYKDSWKSIKDEMVFLTKKEVLNLLKDFDIIKFEEVEKDGKTVLGKLKHWHIYDIIAKKRI